MPSEPAPKRYLRRKSRSEFVSYYQDIVTEYLRADRAMFVNTEYFIQLDAADVTSKGKTWYCDIVAVSFRDEKVYLCEVTYSKTMDALVKRLKAWSTNWSGVCAALVRDSVVPAHWSIQPWLFVPAAHAPLLKQKLASLHNVVDGHGQMPSPQIRNLESVAPWKYPGNCRLTDPDDDKEGQSAKK
jgi:hypothetical protein